MRLARIAAARAETLFAEEAEAPPPEPAEPAKPNPHTAPLTPAQSHAFTFARLSNAVRQALALESRLAADEAAALAGIPKPRPAFDPRRAVLRHVLQEAVANDPDRARRRREVADRLDAELAEDADQAIAIPDLLVTIAEDLDIAIDWSRVPDECLTPDPDYTPPTTKDEFQSLLDYVMQGTGPPPQH